MNMYQEFKRIVEGRNVVCALIRIKGDFFELERGYSPRGYEIFLNDLYIDLEDCKYQIDGTIWFNDNTWASWVNYGGKYEDWEIFSNLDLDERRKEMRRDAMFYSQWGC